MRVLADAAERSVLSSRELRQLDGFESRMAQLANRHAALLETARVRLAQQAYTVEMRERALQQIRQLSPSEEEAIDNAYFETTFKYFWARLQSSRNGPQPPARSEDP
jgi:hypothetical protein